MTRSDPDKRPKWLSCKNALIPDMLAIDPFKMPVFEITGAEFTKSEAHTADGISIRFPRITKQRNDKSATDATTLKELKHLFEASKDGQNLQMLTDGLDDDDIDIKTALQGTSPKKRKPEDSPKKRELEEEDIDNKNQIPKKRKQEDSSSSKNPKDGDDQKKRKEAENQTKRKEGDIQKKRKQEIDDIDVKATQQANSPKKRKQEKVESKNAKEVTSGHSHRSAGNDGDSRKNNDIFKDIVLYVCDDARMLCTEELRYFKKWWGNEATNAKECTHALHKSDSTAETLESAR